MIGRLLRRLDAHGLDDPDANEGFPEDRCPTCGRPVADHVGRHPYTGPLAHHAPAKWPHRFYALLELI